MPDLDAPAIMPRNLIAIWSGLIVDIPIGWLLCDGTSRTPDLRSKFVKCVPDAVTDPGSLGGEDTHVLTIAELPIHGHGITDPTHDHSKISGGFAGIAREDGCTTCQQIAGGVSDETTELTLTNIGSDATHENKPSFFEILYIMRRQ